MSLSAELNEIKKLREENARLRALLTRHGIVWEEKADVKAKTKKPAMSDSQLLPSKKNYSLPPFVQGTNGCLSCPMAIHSRQIRLFTGLWK